MPNTYYHIGKFPEEIASACNLTPGEIYINQDRLSHIESKHGKELNSVGLCAIDFVRIIVEHFDMVVNQNNGTYKLVKHNPMPHSPYTLCMIEMTQHTQNGITWWRVNTAQPQEKPLKGGKTIMWTKKR